MNITKLWASGKGRTNREYSKLKWIILVCMLITAGIVASPAGAQVNGTNSTTQSAQATAPQEVNYLCASKLLGSLRYVTSPSQCSTFFENRLNLSVDGPVYACAYESSYARRVSAPGQCYPGETGLTLPGDNAVYFCAANSGGRLRYVTNTSRCASGYETVVVVSPANHAPVANGQSVSTDEDTAKNITLTASDPDGDTLTYAIVNSQPTVT